MRVFEPNHSDRAIVGADSGLVEGPWLLDGRIVIDRERRIVRVLTVPNIGPQSDGLRQAERPRLAESLEPRAMHALCCLIEHAPKAVNKDTLAKACGDYAMTDAALTQAIRQARVALQDESRSVIVTERGVGYRLAVPVVPFVAGTSTLQDNNRAAASDSRRAIPRGRWMAAALFATLIVAAVMWATQQQAMRASADHAASTRSPTEPVRIAVLPFEVLATTAPSLRSTDEAAVGVGAHFSLAEQLGQFTALRVIAPQSSARAAENASSVREIGEQLDVAHVLEGTIQRAHGTVRINAQLIRTSDDSHVWAQRFDQPPAALPGVYAQIVRAVATSIGVADAAEQPPALSEDMAQAKAMELVDEALMQFNRSIATQSGVEQAYQLVQKALSSDPRYARAHAVEADLLSYAHWFGIDLVEDECDVSARAVNTAMARDRNSAQVWKAQGQYRDYCFGDVDGALASYAEALTRNPSLSAAHTQRAHLQKRLGQYDIALMALREAATLNPNDAWIQMEVGLLLANLQRPNEARPWFDRSVVLSGNAFRNVANRALFLAMSYGEIDAITRLLDHPELQSSPQLDPHLVHLSYVWQGRYVEAAKTLDDAHGNWLLAPGADGGKMPKTVISGLAYRFAGDEQATRARFSEALASLAAIEQPTAGEHFARALAYAGLGDKARALDAVERSLDNAAGRAETPAEQSLKVHLAYVYVMLNENDLLEPVLRDIVGAPYGLRRGQIEHLPIWASIREQPRFAEIFAQQL